MYFAVADFPLNGNITDGIYAGTRIGMIFAIGPVPESSSLVLGLMSLTAFAGYRLVRRKKNPDKHPNPESLIKVFNRF